MTGGAYYNEIDLHAAQWLRNLIAAGHIAPGVVDTRSIEDVQPDDLHGFTQCHFFAGIGVWSYALRRGGWTDDRPVWTGSCPCQPFSEAGEGLGFADERHLWPAFQHLIKERKPAIVLGEQVASKDAGPWIDLVHTDMEAMGYAFGAVPFPSAGVGAPHIRDRLYWVADAAGKRSLPSAQRRLHRGEKGARARDGEPQRPGAVSGLADTIESERGRRPQHGALLIDRAAAGRNEITSDVERDCETGRMADANGVLPSSDEGSQPGVCERTNCAGGSRGDAIWPGPANGFWRDADWLGCQDGKWRPVEPGSFPLADGAPSRVGRLRAYGNAINAEAAIAWVQCVMAAA